MSVRHPPSRDLAATLPRSTERAAVKVTLPRDRVCPSLPSRDVCSSSLRPAMMRSSLALERAGHAARRLLLEEGVVLPELLLLRVQLVRKSACQKVSLSESHSPLRSSVRHSPPRDCLFVTIPREMSESHMCVRESAGDAARLLLILLLPQGVFLPELLLLRV